jgi:signal transduction histidine kinase
VRASASSRDDLARLLEEQAALRRVATLVARGVTPTKVFAAVAQEVGQLLDVDSAHVGRYEPDGSATTVAGWTKGGDELPLGIRIPLDDQSLVARVLRTGRAQRVDNYENLPGALAAAARALGVRSSVGVPIEVEGRFWGIMAVSSRSDEPLPADTEDRTTAFTELVGTAIANGQARTEVTRLGEAQAALRRVATLAARGATADDVFTAVAEEVGLLLGVEYASMFRFDGEASATIVADRGARAPDSLTVGTQLPLSGDNVTAQVRRTGRPARIDDYAKVSGPIAAEAHKRGIRAAVATPIVVEGRLWGAMVGATRKTERLPPDTVARIGAFTELVATAIANTEARAEVARLAQEQAALRRVATLVARGASPTEVFDAVAGEMAGVLDAEQVIVSRFEPEPALTILTNPGHHEDTRGRGTRLALDGPSVARSVWETGRPARIDDWEGLPGSLAAIARDTGIGSSVGAPLIVEGRVWGVIAASWGTDPPPAATEERMMEFAELVDTAIANADSRAELTASRARVLDAGDSARRRVVRDLHDGAQQRLVHTIVTLKLAQRSHRQRDGTTESLIAEALAQAEEANAELRELAHGMHPSALTHGGLRAGVDALVSRINLPVTVDVAGGRYSSAIEASAYFVVAEALTNVVKHARARQAQVTASVDAGVLGVEVRDDGVGGADPDGDGLVGLDDRVAALGGQLRIHSPPGEGTLVAATLPLAV